jgi:2-keto-4-pentenoate hydratase/2-oxohepta-3-ene-1,7-dioic acid hydratase in catechol pathway
LDAAAEPRYPLSDVRLEAPINDPQKFLAIGMNYKAHAEEAIAAGHPAPDTQAWFNKQVSCISGPHDPIELPRVSEMLDYEGELAYVIGKRCHDVSEEDALSVIAGYMCCNDVSVRDYQASSPTATLGKSFDTHGPIGPWITTADEVADPHALDLRLWVNGEQRQHGLTNDMVYNINQQIAYISTIMTLEPGDILATGTPSGVGIATRNWLKHGDIVRLEIDGLGAIENRVEAEA